MQETRVGIMDDTEKETKI